MARTHIRPGFESRVRVGGLQNGVAERSSFVLEGKRNNFLFNECRRRAVSARSLDELVTFMLDLNSKRCRPPLSDHEIHATAGSVWSYKEQERLFVPRGENAAVTTRSEFRLLRDEPDALVLLTFLKIQHGGRLEPFPVVTEAMTKPS